MNFRVTAIHNHTSQSKISLPAKGLTCSFASYPPMPAIVVGGAAGGGRGPSLLARGAVPCLGGLHCGGPCPPAGAPQSPPCSYLAHHQLPVTQDLTSPVESRNLRVGGRERHARCTKLPPAGKVAPALKCTWCPIAHAPPTYLMYTLCLDSLPCASPSLGPTPPRSCMLT